MKSSSQKVALMTVIGLGSDTSRIKDITTNGNAQLLTYSVTKPSKKITSNHQTNHVGCSEHEHLNIALINIIDDFQHHYIVTIYTMER